MCLLILLTLIIRFSHQLCSINASRVGIKLKIQLTRWWTCGGPHTEERIYCEATNELFLQVLCSICAWEGKCGCLATQGITWHRGIIPGSAALFSFLFTASSWSNQADPEFTLCFEWRGSVAWLTCKGGDGDLGGALVSWIKTSGTKDLLVLRALFFSVMLLRHAHKLNYGYHMFLFAN